MGHVHDPARRREHEDAPAEQVPGDGVDKLLRGDDAEELLLPLPDVAQPLNLPRMAAPHHDGLLRVDFLFLFVRVRAVALVHRDVQARRLPLLAKFPGGSLRLQSPRRLDLTVRGDAALGHAVHVHGAELQLQRENLSFDGPLPLRPPALLVGPDQKWLTTEGFLEKINENLGAALA